MNKITVSDFAGGILESNNSADFTAGTWSKLKGFIPRNSYTMESQWPIQSIGISGETWTDNTEHIKAVYPLQSVLGIFLVALKEDGSLWWAKAPEANDDYTVANGVTWTELVVCENVGWDANDNEVQPPNILITKNPDYRFITQLPFEVFKYVKQPDINEDFVSITISSFSQDASSYTTATLSLASGQENELVVGDEVYVKINGHTAQTGLRTISDISDTTITYLSSGGAISTTSVSNSYVHSPALRGTMMEYDTLVGYETYTKGIVSGVLISSRRRYTDAGFDFMTGISADNHQSLVAYVDPTDTSIKVVSFPNIRRWPSYKVNDERAVEYTITGNNTTRYLNITTQDYHEFKKGNKIKIKGMSTKLDGTYSINSIQRVSGTDDYTYIQVKLKSPKKFKNVTTTVCKGTIEALNASYKSIVPFISTNKISSGKESTFISRFPRQEAGSSYTVNHKAYSGGVLSLTLTTTPSDIVVGTTITVASVDSTFNGTYVVTDVTGNVVSYNKYLTSYNTDVSASATGTLSVPVTTGYPVPGNYGHPYTYYDGDFGLNPGTGFIPRGNVGTMWGNHLIIGDIEWRSDAASTASDSKKLKPNQNNALLGTDYNDDVLRDGNTSANRGAFYYSDTQMDEFNPISVLNAAGTDTRIVGMHQLSNRLVIITTSGSENDGVIVYSGLLSQLHPYNPGTVANPIAVRRQVIKGAVGPADFKDDEHWDVAPTCLWPDANMVVFIDKRGGIYATDATTVQRLDNFGPRIPRGSAPQDWVAATGKNLLVWNQANYSAEKGANSARLLCFTLMTSANGQASGAWTELVGPAELDDSGNYLIYNLKSVYGCGSEFYGVVTFYENIDGHQGEIVKSKVMRFAIAGPDNEKGTSDGNKLLLSVATPPIGDTDSFKKIGWSKVGLSFFTQTGAGLVGAITKGASALEEQIPVVNEIGATVNNFAQWDNISVSGGVLDPRVYAKGLHNVLFPSGIGSTPVISVEWILTGDVRLESASVWYTGNVFQYGEDVASEQ